MAKKWCFAKQTPFMDLPNGTKKFDIPFGGVVETTGNQQNVMVSGHNTLWSEITYQNKNGTHSGWVNDVYLEDYLEKFPNFEVVINNPTPEPQDAPQNMIVEGKTKFNMCGELCVAFVVGKDIDSVLAMWKSKFPSFYNNVLAGDRDKATDVRDLESILNAFDYGSDNNELMSFRTALTDPVIGFQPSPRRMQNLLQTHFLIALVNINNYGKLVDNVILSDTSKKKGKPIQVKPIKHWIVLDKISPHDVGDGIVEIYNPFPNKRQEYTFSEFLKSCNSPTWPGWWVTRTPSQ